MNYVKLVFIVVISIFVLTVSCTAQQPQALDGEMQAGSSDAAKSNPAATSKPANATQPASQDETMDKRVTAIESSLKKQTDSDFAVTLGIGSLLIAPGVTDYSNNSNVLQTNSLGRATPQYLVGVSMRTGLPNFRHFGGTGVECKNDETTTDAKVKALATLPAMCEIWRRRPWEAFVNLKLSPQSSSTLMVMLSEGHTPSRNTSMFSSVLP